MPVPANKIGTVSKNILREGLNQFHGANHALNSDVDQEIFGKVTKHNKHDSQEVSPLPAGDHKATRNRHDSTTHTPTWSIANKNDPQKKHALERPVKIILLDGLNRIHVVNLTLSSDVDQDTYLDVWFAWKTPNFQCLVMPKSDPLGGFFYTILFL